MVRTELACEDRLRAGAELFAGTAMLGWPTCLCVAETRWLLRATVASSIALPGGVVGRRRRVQMGAQLNLPGCFNRRVAATAQGFEGGPG